MDNLDRQIRFFRKKQDELARQYHGKSVLVHAEEIVGIFPSDEAAYHQATKAKYEPGTFLIRRCVRSDEEKPAVFHSLVR